MTFSFIQSHDFAQVAEEINTKYKNHELINFSLFGGNILLTNFVILSVEDSRKNQNRDGHKVLDNCKAKYFLCNSFARVQLATGRIKWSTSKCQSCMLNES